MKTSTLLVAAALFATPALAQTTTAPQPGAPAATDQQKPAAPAATNQMNRQTMPQAATGQWRASKLIGVGVYNQQNEKLGDINELILTSNGQVAGAVIGVGGFLGIGERDVMVPLDKLTFRNERGATTGAGTADRQWYPDRAELNATKDQLKDMPEFKY